MLAVTPIGIALGIALLAQPLHPRFVFPCPLYPNATVAFTAALHASCPLAWLDRIDGVVRGGRLERIRGDAEAGVPLASGESAVFRVQPLRGAPYERVVAPVLLRPGEAARRLAAAFALALVPLATVLRTAVRARVPASLPFAWIQAVVGASLVSTAAGLTTSALAIGDALGRATVAGAIVHLGLVFPQRRGIAEQFPEAIAAPYVFAFVGAALEIEAAHRGPALSIALAQRMLLLQTGLGVCLLAGGCAFTLRESPSPLARWQARVLLGGLASGLLAAGWAGRAESADLRLAAAMLLASLLPFPLGHAIARGALADQELSLRRSLARALTLTLGAGGAFVALYALREALGLPEAMRHPTVLFAGLYGAGLVLDPLRAELKRRVDALVFARGIDPDGLGVEHAARIAAQRTPEDVAAAVASAIRSGLGETGVVILAVEGDRFRLLEAVGARGSMATALAPLLAGGSAEPVLDLNRCAHLSGGLQEARDAGVGAIARARVDGRLVACLVLVHARRGRMLGPSERRWVAAVADLAATALVSTQLERELRSAERLAMRGRLESELAHDIGKPLGALEVTAQTLVDHVDPSDALVPQLRKIVRLAMHVRELTRAALDDGARSRAKLEDLVQVACLEVRALHGEQRVRVDELPHLGELPPGFDQLARVLVNLLDNALRASRPEQPVALRARSVADWLEIEIEDHGVGMSHEQLRRAFLPFASFRVGGTGLGLAISRQLVASLGGRLTLAPRREGRGLCALVRVPLVDAAP